MLQSAQTLSAISADFFEDSAIPREGAQEKFPQAILKINDLGDFSM